MATTTHHVLVYVFVITLEDRVFIVPQRRLVVNFESHGVAALSEAFNDAFPATFQELRYAESHVFQIGHLDQKKIEQVCGTAGEIA